MFGELRPLQLVPALLAQSTESGVSDLALWRTAARQSRPRGLKGALANLARSVEEMRALPASALGLVLGNARLAAIGFGTSGNTDPDWAVRAP
jgi:hypothetical protein